MRIWSILLIKSALKWCIHLSRSLFLYYDEEQAELFKISHGYLRGMTTQAWLAMMKYSLQHQPLGYELPLYQ